MKNVIVTGANGFLGKTLVKSLLNNGYSVVALDIRFDDVLANDNRVTCINVNNKEITEIEKEIPEEDYLYLFHLAWAGTSGDARADYNLQLKNIELTCNYVELCKKLKCKRFVYASSINEMETYEYLQSDNIDPSGGYIYGTGKLAAHLMGEIVAKLNDVEFIPVIITNIYGIGEKSARMIYTSIKKLLNNEHCSFTEGYQTYDFIYISDAINSIIAVAEKGKAFNRYYIGSGSPKPLREFLIKMRDIVNPKIEIGLGDIPFKGINVSYEQFDLKKVERDTGYINEIPFDKGIKIDMYPQYWTPSIGGILMKYSYKFKRQCVELYRQGKWPETPKDITEKNFHNTIRVWVRIEDKCGPEALRHKNQRKTWSAEEKYELVAKVLAGASNKETAISAGINAGLLYQWVRCYKIKGYQGLVAQRKGRPPKEPEMKKKIEPAELTPSEREEMILLRAENERLRAEIAIVKKEIALREERCAAQLKAKKLRSSKNCVKKVTN